jgi:DNA-binding NarL/FixJ family response regulator
MGLRSILESESDLEVVAEFGDDGIAEGDLSARSPDLVIADYDGTPYAPHELVSWIRGEDPSVRVFVHSSSFSIATLFTLLRSGVNGFATKNVAAETVRYGVHMVLNGELFICVRDSLGTVNKMPDGFEHMQAEKPSFATTLHELTPREREIFELVAKGYTTHAIGTALGISHRTVENHRSNIMRKLSLHSQIDLVLYAARIGLVDL